MAGTREKRDPDVEGRLRAVRSLWLAVQNDPSAPIREVAAEFFFAVGKLLEGQSLEAIEFRKIDRGRVLAQDREG